MGSDARIATASDRLTNFETREYMRFFLRNQAE